MSRAVKYMEVHYKPIDENHPLQHTHIVQLK